MSTVLLIVLILLLVGARWVCGTVGQFAIRSAFLLGASRVIAIDTVPERMNMAKAAGAQVLDFMKEDIYERIQDLTDGRGADARLRLYRASDFPRSPSRPEQRIPRSS